MTNNNPNGNGGFGDTFVQPNRDYISTIRNKQQGLEHLVGGALQLAYVGAGTEDGEFSNTRARENSEQISNTVLELLSQDTIYGAPNFLYNEGLANTISGDAPISQKAVAAKEMGFDLIPMLSIGLDYDLSDPQQRQQALATVLAPHQDKLQTAVSAALQGKDEDWKNYLQDTYGGSFVPAATTQHIRQTAQRELFGVQSQQQLYDQPYFSAN